jgi:uncharacterized repeat protein (TIGR01451 family)
MLSCLRHLLVLLVCCVCVPTWAQIADLSVTKSGPTSELNGETISYSLTIGNVGPNAANAATFLDTLPAGLSNVSATCTTAINGAACPGSLTVLSTSVSGSIPTLPANGGVTINITARLPVGGTDTSLTNNVSVSAPAGVTDPIPSSNSSFISTALTYRSADLAVTKIASSTSYSLGVPLVYTVTLTNLGPGPADGMTFRDRLTATTVGSGIGGAIVSSIDSYTCTAAFGAACPVVTPPATVTTTGNIFSAAVPSLPAGGSLQFVLQVRPTGYSASTCGFTSISLNNVADITGRPASVTDPVASNDAVTRVATGPASVIPACPQADVGTVKTVTPTGTITFGQPLTYTVAYFNLGPGAADNTVILDRLSLNTAGTGLQAAMGYNAASVFCVSTPGTSCPIFTVPVSGTLTTAATTVVSQTVTSFPAGGRLTLTYTLTPQGLGSATCGYTTFALRNTSSLNLPGGITDPTSGNNTFTVDRAAPARPACAQSDIAASKTLISGQVGINQTLTYRITVSNIGTGTVSNVAFSDTILHSNLGLGVGNPFLSLQQISLGACAAAGPTACPLFSPVPPSLVLTNAAQTLLPLSTVTSMGSGSSLSFTMSYVITGVDATCARTDSIVENRITLATPINYLDTVASNNAGSATVTVSCADISVIKAVTPTTVPAGGSMTFSFDITNVGPATLSNVVFSDPLPAGFTYLSADCAVISGAAVCGSTNYIASPSEVVGTVTSMPAGSQVRYTIVGIASNLPGSWNNQGQVRLPPGILDPDLTSNRSAVSFNVTSDLPSVSKFTTRASSSPGGTTAFTIVVSNPSSGLVASNMRITDLLPSGWSYLTTTAVTLNGTATRPVLQTPTLGDTTPTWGQFNLPATGSSVVIRFVASIPLSQTCGQVVSNVAEAVYSRGGGTLTSAYLGNDPGLTSDDVTIFCPQAGLAKRLLSQADNGDGSFRLDYALRFKNTGSETLNPTQIRDPLANAQSGIFGSITTTVPPLPGEYRIASAPAFFGSCTGMSAQSSFNGGSQLNVATGSLAAGQECEIRFSVQFGATATLSTYTNQAQIVGTGSFSANPVSDLSDDGTDPTPSSINGTGTVNDPTPASIAPSVNLVLSKTNGTDTLVAGSTTTYAIVIDNFGPSGLLNAVLRDQASAGLQCSAVSCTVLSGVAVCPNIGLAAGELSMANLSGTGTLIPRLNSGSRMQIDITCSVLATGLP